MTPDEVHVWRIELALGLERMEELENVLSGEERARFRQIRVETRKRRLIASRAGLRGILGLYFRVGPERVQLSLDSSRGLAVAGQEAVRLSLSHSADLALCAVSRERRVGVDVERLRATIPVGRIAARMFSPGEAAELLGLPELAQRRAFFRLWTGKEAYAKATGEGLASVLKQHEPFAESKPTSAPWSVREVNPGAAYAGAVAVEGNGWRLRLFTTMP